MPFAVVCPAFNHQVELPDQFAGRKVRCRKCKGYFIAESEDEDTPPAVPSRKKQGDNRIAIGAAAVCVLAVCVLIVVLSGQKKAEPTIPYEVLKNTKRPNGQFDMYVVVSEAASREDVLKLAESLRREHAGKYATISIFDPREACQAAHRLDEKYPAKELARHWLVAIVADPAFNDGQEIKWVAEGRDH
jgi:hypothetical protein